MTFLTKKIKKKESKISQSKGIYWNNKRLTETYTFLWLFSFRIHLRDLLLQQTTYSQWGQSRITYEKHAFYWEKVSDEMYLRMSFPIAKFSSEIWIYPYWECRVDSGTVLMVQKLKLALSSGSSVIDYMYYIFSFFVFFLFVHIFVHIMAGIGTRGWEIRSTKRTNTDLKCCLGRIRLLPLGINRTIILLFHRI